MKLLATAALLCAMTACTGCESTPVEAPLTLPITTVETAPATTKFAVGDKVIINFPDGSTENAEVFEVTTVKSFMIDESGATRESQGYVVVLNQTLVGPDGSEMTFRIGVEVPEFALIRQRAINEKR